MIDKSVHSQFASIKLDQLVYVELEARNGGMMLTVSEEGFTFRAVTSVRPSGRIPFSFIINGTEKLEGFGEIKWTKMKAKWQVCSSPMYRQNFSMRLGNGWRN